MREFNCLSRPQQVHNVPPLHGGPDRRPLCAVGQDQPGLREEVQVLRGRRRKVPGKRSCFFKKNAFVAFHFLILVIVIFAMFSKYSSY